VLTCPFVRRIDRHVGPDIGATREVLKQATAGLSIA
jgi:hypothetical protein